MLPFSPDAFFEVFARYNASVWPAPVVAYGLGVAIAILLAWPIAYVGRIISGCLAAMWLWTGAAYHLGHFAAINPAAWFFGPMFLAQGFLLLWTGTLSGRASFQAHPDLAGGVGISLMLFAALLYPLAGYLAGHRWPAAAVFGITPCPTTIFTLGLMLLVRPKVPMHLLAIPLVWSLIGGSAVWLIGIPEDASLPAAGALTLWLAYRSNRGAGTSRQVPPSA